MIHKGFVTSPVFIKYFSAHDIFGHCEILSGTMENVSKTKSPTVLQMQRDEINMFSQLSERANVVADPPNFSPK